MTIYFDNNATTHIDPFVAERMHQLNLAGIANPASQHRAGRKALHLLEEAKSEILECVGASTAGMDAPQVILTSGGTEANNLAINGLYARQPGLAIVGGTDHPSVLEAAKSVAQPDDNYRVLPVDSNGKCDLGQLEQWVRESADSSRQISFVSVMLGNNETGILQDLKAIVDICSPFAIPVHSDVVQAIGKSPVNMRELGLSALTLTAHKIHGPVGIGALIVKSGLELEPMIRGGGQQLGVRAGTEPVVPAVGLAHALKQIIAAYDEGQFARLADLRDRFEQRLTRECDATIIGRQANRLPHTSNLSFPGADRQALQMSLDLNGLACSTGSACSSGSGRPAGSLVAMGLPDSTIQGSLRFSFSRFTTADEVDRGIEIISKAVAKCRHTV